MFCLGARTGKDCVLKNFKCDYCKNKVDGISLSKIRKWRHGYTQGTCAQKISKKTDKICKFEGINQLGGKYSVLSP